MNNYNLEAITKFELEAPSDFQKEIHFTNNEDENDSAHSPFMLEFRKIPLSTLVREILLSNNKKSDNDKYITYNFNSKYSYLLNTILISKLPNLRVKDEYKDKIQICWPLNIGHHIIKSGTFKSGDFSQIIDSVYLDNWYQHEVKKKTIYNKMIGNYSYLTEWSHSTPEHYIKSPQPFFYSKHVGLAYPIHRHKCDIINKGVVELPTQEYHLRTKLSELVRMREKKDNMWVELKKFKPECLEGIDKNTSIDDPIMIGYYSMITPEEKNWIDNEYPIIKMIIEDIVSIEESNTFSLGSSVPVNLDVQYPVKVMYWVIENMTAQKKRNFSNYTTNSDDIKLGYNPCKTFSLMYGSNIKIPETPSFFYDEIEPFLQGGGEPIHSGYNKLSLSYYYDYIFETTGRVFARHKAKMIIKLGNCDPSLSEEMKDSNDEEDINDENNKKNRDKYKIHTKLITVRELIFELGKPVTLTKINSSNDGNLIIPSDRNV